MSRNVGRLTCTTKASHPRIAIYIDNRFPVSSKQFHVRWSSKYPWNRQSIENSFRYQIIDVIKNFLGITAASAVSPTPTFTSSGVLSQKPEDGNGSGLRNICEIGQIDVAISSRFYWLCYKLDYSWLRILFLEGIRTFRHNLQTDMETCTSYYPKGTEGTNLNVQPYLIWSLRKRGAISPFPAMSFWRNTCLSTEITVYLRFMIVLLQFIYECVTAVYRKSCYCNL